jgi:hypothetical protein
MRVMNEDVFVIFSWSLKYVVWNINIDYSCFFEKIFQVPTFVVTNVFLFKFFI